eukprot:TRINITY_DN32185_c0_g1_i1.p1 TRINITY_DN32185_c0_g1~~TRINITY_DN32185_c0_g1_i1.p1  ORF type:complete len:623 (+),score=66.02 TRINITY_DN32185_c0_g1_i1:44-1870(+)
MTHEEKILHHYDDIRHHFTRPRALNEQEEMHILAQAGPLVAVLKPRGLAVEAPCHPGDCKAAADCVLQRLAQQLGGKWCALSRFWLPKKLHGVVYCADVRAGSALNDVAAGLVELSFETVVFTAGANASATVLENESLSLPAIGCEATLCKLEEAGRLTHILVRVVVTPTSPASSAAVADALTDAFATACCPIVGTLKGCRRLKLKNSHGLENFKLLSLVRVKCAALDSTIVPPHICLEHVLAEERSFVVEEELRKAQCVTSLIDVLTGPKAAEHSEYAPELQSLNISRLGSTSEAARTVLDSLGLGAPTDVAWTNHARGRLEAHLLEQWHTQPRERQRLQYGMHVSRLLCCCVRVQQPGNHAPVEFLVQGSTLLCDQQLSGPLRATELSFDRSNHCEILALNQAFTLCTEYSHIGQGCKVDLMVAHQPCVSCTAAMCNFIAMLPEVRFRIDFCDWSSMQRVLNVALREAGEVDDAIPERTPLATVYTATVPEPDPDTRFLVKRVLGINLGLTVGNVYTYADLLARCKGKPAKIARLINFTADESQLERQLETVAVAPDPLEKSSDDIVRFKKQHWLTTAAPSSCSCCCTPRELLLFFGRSVMKTTRS